MTALLRILNAAEIHEKNARLIAELARETDPNIELRPSSDDRNERLRGIPAVGQNVTGAIPGTNPEWVIA